MAGQGAGDFSRPRGMRPARTRRRALLSQIDWPIMPVVEGLVDLLGKKRLLFQLVGQYTRVEKSSSLHTVDMLSAGARRFKSVDAG